MPHLVSTIEPILLLDIWVSQPPNCVHGRAVSITHLSCDGVCVEVVAIKAGELPSLPLAATLGRANLASHLCNTIEPTPLRKVWVN